MSKRLDDIMSIKEKEKKEIELRKYTKELKCSLQGTYTSNGIHLEQEVIRRIREAEQDLENRNPLEIKPNYFGVSMNLRKVWRWIKNKKCSK